MPPDTPWVFMPCRTPHQGQIGASPSVGSGGGTSGTAGSARAGPPIAPPSVRSTRYRRALPGCRARVSRDHPHVAAARRSAVRERSIAHPSGPWVLHPPRRCTLSRVYERGSTQYFLLREYTTDFPHGQFVSRFHIR